MLAKGELIHEATGIKAPDASFVYPIPGHPVMRPEARFVVLVS